MSEALEAWTWRLEDAPVALEAIGQRLGIASSSEEVARFSPDREAEDLGFGRFVEAIAGALGVEVEPVFASYADAETMLRACGPALVRMRSSAEDTRFVAILDGRGGKLRVLGSDLCVHRIRVDAVKDCWAEPLVRAARERIDGLLDRAGVSGARRDAARAHLVDHRFGGAKLGGCWLVRAAPGGELRPLIREAGVFRNFAAMLGAHAGQYALMIASWALLGGAALDGRVETSQLGGWLLLLASMVPLQMLARWFQGRLSVGLGGVIKNRLLAGVLRLDAETIRDEGSGHLLARVLESEAVGQLGLGAGLLAVVAVMELVMAVMVLAAGAGGLVHAGLLVLWVAFTAAWSFRYFRTRQRTTATRMELTHDLVERIVGHRTRIAQQHPARWHDDEDQAMNRYVELCRSLDRLAIILGAVIDRGWMIVGLIGLLPAVGSDATTISFAIGLGGVFMGERALASLTSGLSSLAGAAISWQQARPLFAAAREPARTAPTAKLRGKPDPEHAIIDAQNLAFRYPGRGQSVLRECSFRVYPGDRVLIEGPSGGGKSTLASLLSGLRQPDHGLLFARGLDRASLGPEGWRQVVATAPQFHDNHVLTGTIAFNLLMGSSHVVARGAEALGLAHGPLPRNIKGCRGSAVCPVGCPRAAKQSTNVSYVPAALAAGARLYPGMRAHRIVVERGRAVGVVAVATDGGPTLTVDADIVISACGTIPGVPLLRRALRSRHLGRHLTVHPCTKVVALMPEAVDAWRDTPQGYAITSHADEGILYEGVYLTPEYFSLAIPFGGERFARLAQRYRNLATFGAMVADEPNGRVLSVAGEPLMLYQLGARDRERLQRATATLAEVFFAAGAEEVVLPIAGADPVRSMDEVRRAQQGASPWRLELAAFHPLGTARMASRRDEGVLDPDLQSWEVPGLYVVDGSIFPSSLGVNPQLTIMAFATRAAQHIADRLDARRGGSRS